MLTVNDGYSLDRKNWTEPIKVKPAPFFILAMGYAE
jgi:hypothetical protein